MSEKSSKYFLTETDTRASLIENYYVLADEIIPFFKVLLNELAHHHSHLPTAAKLKICIFKTSARLNIPSFIQSELTSNVVAIARINNHKMDYQLSIASLEKQLRIFERYYSLLANALK